MPPPGDPAKLQTMYGAAGERRLPELTLDWLPGYENSRPVRIGNAAVKQFQLDVYGEVIDALHVARNAGLEPDGSAWALEKVILDFVERAWREPDEGIWEVRGPRRHFVHSKVLAWVAFDRSIKSAEAFHLEGPVEKWRKIRQEIHDDVCATGLQRDAGHLHAVLRRHRGRRQPAADSAARIPALLGSARRRDDRGRGARAL